MKDYKENVQIFAKLCNYNEEVNKIEKAAKEAKKKAAEAEAKAIRIAKEEEAKIIATAITKAKAEAEAKSIRIAKEEEAKELAYDERNYDLYLAIGNFLISIFLYVGSQAESMWNTWHTIKPRWIDTLANWEKPIIGGDSPESTWLGLSIVSFSFGIYFLLKQYILKKHFPGTFVTIRS